MLITMDKNQQRLVPNELKPTHKLPAITLRAKALAAAQERAFDLAIDYDIDGYKVNGLNGQLHYLTSARRTRRGINAVYSSEANIIAAYIEAYNSHPANQ